jgi:hypothetical protein
MCVRVYDNIARTRKVSSHGGAHGTGHQVTTQAKRTHTHEVHESNKFHLYMLNLSISKYVSICPKLQ